MRGTARGGAELSYQQVGVAWPRPVKAADIQHAHVCSRMLTYAHVCSRMLTYAWSMQVGVAVLQPVKAAGIPGGVEDGDGSGEQAAGKQLLLY